jgi:hypothetical protein
MTVTSPAMTLQVRGNDKVLEPLQAGRRGNWLPVTEGK